MELPKNYPKNLATDRTPRCVYCVCIMQSEITSVPYLLYFLICRSFPQRLKSQTIEKALKWICLLKGVRNLYRGRDYMLQDHSISCFLSRACYTDVCQFFKAVWSLLVIFNNNRVIYMIQGNSSLSLVGAIMHICSLKYWLCSHTIFYDLLQIL